MSPEESSTFQIFGALVIDQIWRTRNAVLFEKAVVDMDRIQMELMGRYKEHLASAVPATTREPLKRTVAWTPPLHGAIKINCDAAVSQNISYVAIVARDWRGKMVFAMTKRVETTIPVQAEAEAINWATQQALCLGTRHVIVESDAKICIDALRKPTKESPWRIAVLITDTLRLAKFLQNIQFSWIPRSANNAHGLASGALGSFK